MSDFAEEQKEYLQGFFRGADLARASRGLSTFATALGTLTGAPPPGVTQPPPAPPTGPDAIHRAAQDRAIAAGKKLTPQEQAKRTKHPLDMWDDLIGHADAGNFPKGDDVLAFKYHGLFYVAPAQDSYMCRLRIPGGIIDSHQFRAVAGLSEEFGGGYVDATTRANLQIREIAAADGPSLLVGLQEIGIVPRGSGADNIRNVTASPTAGIDPQELIDTRPLARAMHHHIFHHREFYGLPRKFNIAFDGGGRIGALEDTNDIGFSAVRVSEGKSVPAGVYFRLLLGGISGHEDFAGDEGVLLTPEQCVPVASAVLRIFIDEGDRADRKKSRLKYVLDRWGHDKFTKEVDARLPAPMTRFPLGECELRPPVDKHGHIGFHPQRQEGKSYVGVLLPVGRMFPDQMRGLAAIADRHGSGTIRLTVWQNLLISDIADAEIPAVRGAIEALGLGTDAGSARAGLVACTGNAGCKFAASNTKRHALAIADHVDSVLKLDRPVNIHVTGCPNSCAQHFIGDIGLLGAGVEVGDDLVEGYHLFVGGGYGDEQGIGREVFRSVAATDAPMVIEGILRGYLGRRESPGESFDAFVRRHPTDQLKLWFESMRPALA